MPGGSARGQGFDKDFQTMYERFFSKTSADEFKDACLKMGAAIKDGKADVTAVFSYAPRFPICITFWEADDEFPASGKTLVDKNAYNYLEVEAAGGACASVVMRIDEVLKKTMQA